MRTAVDDLLTAFSLLLTSLVNLRLVLNTKKTKYMIFTHSLYPVYHAALRFVTDTKARTHNCKLYEMVK